MSLDIDFVRDQFPAFAEPSLQGQAFFENAGGSYACRPVIERLMRFYTQRKVQPYSAYEASRLAGEEMDEAHRGMAALLGVAPDEVSFGPSTTQNTYVLAQAFAQFMQEGEAIIVTNQDHEANSGPWRRLVSRGIEIREWKVDPQTGMLCGQELERLLDEKVRLVCFPHCSNVIGHINPVSEITALAHAAGAFVCVDGVSYAPHGFADVGAMGPDIYLFSAYKTYGPHQGVMVIRRALAQLLPNQGHYFNADSLYKKFTPAGPDHAQVAACAGMVDYIELLYEHHFNGGEGVCRSEKEPSSRRAPVEKATAVHDLMRAHETALLEQLLTALQGRNALRVLGPQEAGLRAPTVAIRMNRPVDAVAKALAGEGVMAGAGDFYAVRTLEALGIDPQKEGVLRLSFTHYTSQEDMNRLLTALDKVL